MAIEDWHKSVRDFIPPGFDLTRYEACKNYGVGDWLLESLFRKLIKDSLTLPEEEEERWPSREFHFGLYTERNKELDRNPEARDGFVDARFVYEGSSVVEMLNRDFIDLNQYAMKDEFFKVNLKILDGVEADHPKKKDLDQLSKNIGNLDLSEAVSFYMKSEEVFNCYPAHPKISILLVDTETPDEILKENFDSWLRGMREKQRQKFSIPHRKGVKITKALLKSLHENRVLPYLDIKLWLSSQGAKQPIDHQWLYILFPHKGATSYEKSSDNFKKQTIKQADWLVSDGYQLLRLAYAKEKQHENTPEHENALEPAEKLANSLGRIRLFSRFNLSRKGNR